MSRREEARPRLANQLAALLATSLAVAGCVPSSGGPLVITGGEGDSVVHIQTDVGRTVVYGVNYVTNSGDKPLRLLDAALIGDVPRSSASVIDVRMVDFHRDDRGLLGADQWPSKHLPEGEAAPLEGHVLAAGAEVELLFIVRVRKPGTWRWSDTNVTYEYHGKRYVETINNGFLVCAPANTRCDPRASSSAKGR